jgi:hypothetical protein
MSNIRQAKLSTAAAQRHEVLSNAAAGTQVGSIGIRRAFDVPLRLSGRRGARCSVHARPCRARVAAGQRYPGRRLSPRSLHRRTCSMASELVVAFALELKQTEAVPKGIVQQR